MQDMSVSWLESLAREYPEQRILLRMGMDRYGFSQLVSRELGLATTPRSFGNWLHGWIWWPASTPIELMFEQSLARKLHIVANQQQKDTLQQHGFDRVIVGGLPFAYTSPSSLPRRVKTLLAMPPHSPEGRKLRKSFREYLEFLEASKGDFETVCLSLHANDYGDSELVNLIRSMGMSCILGAAAGDANGLMRMRAIFDSFEYVTTNTMGSHIAYGMFSGAKVSISGPLYPWDESDMGHIDWAGAESYRQTLLETRSAEYIRKVFDDLIYASPIEARVDVGKGADFVGYENRLRGKMLKQAMSWTVPAYCHGVFEATVMRAKARIGLS